MSGTSDASVDSVVVESAMLESSDSVISSVVSEDSLPEGSSSEVALSEASSEESLSGSTVVFT